MGGEHIFDLEGRDVLGVADNRVLDSAGDPHIAVGVDQPEIAGAQPAFIVERVGVERGLRVAQEALRSLEPQLPLVPDGQFGFVVVDHANAHPRYRCADGVIEHLGRGVKRR
ncbi:hypothetical protein ATCCBAA256_02950 [Mycobacterium montefiorense]|nr:hypothetical protein ATCCBAA256_02950 [Mycobacterium montefiorense]